MAGQDAGRAQYAPTSVPSIGPPQQGQPQALPYTGYPVAVAWALLAGLVLVALGTLLRPFIRKGGA